MLPAYTEKKQVYQLIECELHRLLQRTGYCAIKELEVNTEVKTLTGTAGI